MNNNFSYTLAAPSDIDSIYNLMEYARKENKHNGFFYADSRDYIFEHINSPYKGFIIIAMQQQRVIGFLIIHNPSSDSDNMASYSSIPISEYNKTIYFDSTVVHPDYRGHKIMSSLLLYAEKYISSKLPQYCHIFATVHPDNLNSLNNFLNHNFRIIATTNKYNNLPRHILYKQLSSPLTELDPKNKIPQQY